MASTGERASDDGDSLASVATPPQHRKRPSAKVGHHENDGDAQKIGARSGAFGFVREPASYAIRKLLKLELRTFTVSICKSQSASSLMAANWTNPTAGLCGDWEEDSEIT